MVFPVDFRVVAVVDFGAGVDFSAVFGSGSLASPCFASAARSARNLSFTSLSISTCPSSLSARAFVCSSWRRRASSSAFSFSFSREMESESSAASFVLASRASRSSASAWRSTSSRLLASAKAAVQIAATAWAPWVNRCLGGSSAGRGSACRPFQVFIASDMVVNEPRPSRVLTAARVGRMPSASMESAAW